MCINEVGGSVSDAGMGTEFRVWNLTMTDCSVLHMNNSGSAIAVTLFADESRKIQLQVCLNCPGIAM